MTTPADLLIGVDSSTQSTKAIAWDRHGKYVAEGRAPIPMNAEGNGVFEQQPEDWWRALCGALHELWRHVDPRRIAGLAIANQRETLAFLDESGASVRPAITWLDERGLAWLPVLSERLGADYIHRVTGKWPDVTPGYYKLAWMQQHDKEALDRTAFIADVQAYLVLKLCGRLATSWSSADPSGAFDIHRLAWSSELLKPLALSTDKFAPAFASGTLLGEVSNSAASQSGLLPGTKIYAGGGDGQCAGVGVGCTSPGRAYINLGTAIVSGVWSHDPAISRSWRTLVAASGSGYILETVQRTGTHLVNWLLELMGGPTSPAALLSELEAAASAVPIGCNGLLVSPYWSGCMNPHWDSSARGAIVGLSNSHGREQLYRAVLEGLTMETARAARAMSSVGAPVEVIAAIGGGAKSPLWVQMLADTLGSPVGVSKTVEATSLGAAMIAAFGAGWYCSIEAAAANMGAALMMTQPEASRHSRYLKLMDIHASVYEANAATIRALRSFTTATV